MSSVWRRFFAGGDDSLQLEAKRFTRMRQQGRMLQEDAERAVHGPIGARGQRRIKVNRRLSGHAEVLRATRTSCARFSVVRSAPAWRVETQVPSRS